MVDRRRGLICDLLVCSVLLLCGLLASCGPTTSSANRKKSDSAVLLVQCEVSDAEVWLNSRYYRTVGEFTRGVRLRPGLYRVEVRHDGFHSMYYEVELAAKERRTLEVKLAQRFR